MFRNELKVEDLPRMPSRFRVGDDALEAAEPCRNNGAPGIAKDVEARARALGEGDGRGDCDPWARRPILSVEGERIVAGTEDSPA